HTFRIFVNRIQTQEVTQVALPLKGFPKTRRFPKTMSYKTIARLVLQQNRQFSRTATASSGEVAEGYKQLRHIQEKFQKPDGKPVFLKGGPMDNVLFSLTMVLSLVGLAGIGKLFYDLSYPKKDD
uniref:Cytochrome c oxidase subunit viia n=2 Tax=Anopheles stephensi TaxID=30069 RepID=A0A182YQW5_ANOST